MTGPLQALAARYERLAARGELPAYGFSEEKISFVLVLDRDGMLVDVQPLHDATGRRPRPRSMLVPAAVKRTSGIASNFLWDKSSYVLGVAANSKRLAEEHEAFRKLHEELLAGVDDEGTRALLAFLRTWTPQRFALPPFSADMLDTNLVFRLDGDSGFLHERAAAREAWLAASGDAEAAVSACLITGRSGPIARLHPAIKGVMGAQSSGASLVSFNQEAFASHGKEQGANAPVSEAAAFGYGTALNALLARESRNRVRLGDSTVVFWAEAEKAETIVRGLFDPPAPDDQSEAASLHPILEQMARGRPIREVVPEIDPATRFYILALAPNAARLSIRFWLESSFGELAERFQAWWRDLRVEPDPWRGGLPAIWRLLHELAAQRKTENVPAHLAGEITRAVLAGGPLPRSLLATTIMRLRADHDLNGRRAAICKSVLVRELRRADPDIREDYLVSLDPHDSNPGYRLGRLFAVLESVQRSAMDGNINATIRDRYYGAASATPASVFPVLIRNVGHHLAALRKKRGGLARTLEKEMEGIIKGIGSAFPRNLGIDDQGRFAIGYYHQKSFSRAAIPPENEPADTTDTASED
ncbi:type I-C CRISPR-associated protein Cas8c/Csd1 [Marinimicrococcus flavescens]|uniref:Type I-C CRISPR-associated protein Cas8c/Csd1 n=1 Tax=Marinimicrococcus flavescens TaxID=3031815 RepID=A0AAP3XRX1_9PROT|nr:type I-C CRISPR-associated protein Cas8c/Csd1 [Marinimicrococcus flavescens]